jgi:glycosyltransferase involved in cell wall biosynthesis
VAEVLVENGIPEGRVRVVPDGLPPDAFVEKDMPAFPPYRLVHAGAFDGRKGQGLAVEVLAGLTGRGRDVTLTLLGEGPERAPIEALARKLGVANRCFFKGLVDNVAQEFASAHLLLLPSDSEGAPLVLAEAMAAGCPSVAHDIGGVRELLCDGRAGLLIPGLRTRDWEEAVASLLDSAIERTHLVDAGRRAASERTIETTAEILLYEFRKLSERIEVEP